MYSKALQILLVLCCILEYGKNELPWRDVVGDRAGCVRAMRPPAHASQRRSRPCPVEVAWLRPLAVPGAPADPPAPQHSAASVSSRRMSLSPTAIFSLSKSLPPPKKKVMFSVRSVCLSVCLSVCSSDYSQTCEWILTKFFGGVGHGSRTK